MRLFLVALSEIGQDVRRLVLRGIAVALSSQPVIAARATEALSAALRLPCRVATPGSHTLPEKAEGVGAASFLSIADEFTLNLRPLGTSSDTVRRPVPFGKEYRRSDGEGLR